MHHAPCTRGEKMPSTPCRPLRRVTRRNPVARDPRDQGIDPRESSRPSLDGHQKRIQTCVLSQISSAWWFQHLPTPLKNDGVSNSWDDDIPNIWKKKSCSKAPTSDDGLVTGLVQLNLNPYLNPYLHGNKNMVSG